MAVELVVDRTQHVGGVLDVLDRQPLEQIGHIAVAALQRLADRRVIFVGGADRLLEDRRVGGDALHAVGVDKLLQDALGDEAASQKIQPDRLAMAFECFDGIHCVLPFELIDGEVRLTLWPGGLLSTRGPDGWPGELYPETITPFGQERSSESAFRRPFPAQFFVTCGLRALLSKRTMVAIRGSVQGVSAYDVRRRSLSS